MVTKYTYIISVTSMVLPLSEVSSPISPIPSSTSYNLEGTLPVVTDSTTNTELFSESTSASIKAFAEAAIIILQI